MIFTFEPDVFYLFNLFFRNVINEQILSIFLYDLVKYLFIYYQIYKMNNFFNFNQ